MTQLDRARFDAVVLDLDGVVTDTAAVHAAAWRRLFDDYLGARVAQAATAAQAAQAVQAGSTPGGEDHRPFTDADYRRYVDGKPRYDGVHDFLAARGITLPWGNPGDPPDAETVCGLGNRKDRDVLARLAQDGVRVFPDTVDFLDRVRAGGMRAGIISASRNCAAVLAAAGLSDRFDARVDGIVAEEMDLPGKPDPAVFREAARRLGVAPQRTVVVEDAQAGVQAGRRGGFGLVVGLARTGHPEELAGAGADVVVRDLGALAVSGEPSPEQAASATPGKAPA